MMIPHIKDKFLLFSKGVATWVGELNLDSDERQLSTEVKMDPFFCECLSKKIVKMWRLSQPCGVAVSPGS